MKPIPKSLHTVTVLVAIARDQATRDAIWEDMMAEELVDNALLLLGLADSPDVYGLRDQAIRKLSKGGAA